MLVFSLHFTYWDDPREPDGTNIVARPALEAFADAALAAASNEGLGIMEGDLWFFAADGSPLEAVFSEQPYVDTERLKYFAGRYSLQPGTGKTLREIIADRCPAVPQIIVKNARSEATARRNGWSTVEEVKSKVREALHAAVPDLAKSAEFEVVR